MDNPHSGQPVAQRGAALGAGRCVVLLMHGRGRDPDDVLALAARIGEPGVTYLAPAAGGGSWYPRSFLEPLERNEPQLSYALDTYHELVAGLLARGLRREQIVLAGFSQGACLSAEYLARHAGPYGGALIFTGGLIGPPGTAWAYGGHLAGTPVLIGGSSADAFVPAWRMDESAAILRAMGGQVQELRYAGEGHLVSDDEIAAARLIIRAAAAPA